MSETRWTKGPWEISYEPPRWIIQAEMPIGKKAVAFLVGDYVECSGSAHLIASAPELYEALEALLAPYDGIFGKSGHLGGCDASTIEAAFAALARSRGEAS